MESSACEIASEVGRISDKEGAQRRSGACLPGSQSIGLRVACRVIVERYLTRPMRVASDALLQAPAQVCPPLQSMIAELLGPIVHDLEVVFGFFQRAVALIDPQRIPEVESAAAVDVEAGHAAGLR